MVTAFFFVTIMQNYSKRGKLGIKYNLDEVFPPFHNIALVPWLLNLFDSIPDCTFPFEVNIKTDDASEAGPARNSRGKH